MKLEELELEELELEVQKMVIQKLEELELERQKQPPPSRFIANTTTSTHPSCSLIRQADSPCR